MLEGCSDTQETLEQKHGRLGNTVSEDEMGTWLWKEL